MRELFPEPDPLKDLRHGVPVTTTTEGKIRTIVDVTQMFLQPSLTELGNWVATKQFNRLGLVCCISHHYKGNRAESLRTGIDQIYIRLSNPQGVDPYGFSVDLSPADTGAAPRLVDHDGVKPSREQQDGATPEIPIFPLTEALGQKVLHIISNI